MVNQTLVNLLVVVNVSMINLFFKIKGAKIDRTFRKISGRKLGAAAGPYCGNDDFNNNNESTSQFGHSVVPARSVSTTFEAGGRSNLNVTTQAYSKHPQWQPPPGYEEYQCHGEAQSRLPKIDTYVRCYYCFSHLANWYLLIKNILICMMRFELFARLRALDCYMLGRFIINGRVLEVTSYCACFLAMTKLLWQYTMMREQPEFRMPCIEFLVDKRAHELCWSRHEKSKMGYASNCRDCHGHGKMNDNDRLNLARHCRNPKKNGGCECQPSGPEDEYYSTLLEWQDPFVSQEEANCMDISHYQKHQALSAFKLRPNRTREAWDDLAQIAIRYYMGFLVIILFLAISIYRMALAVVFSHRGFVYNYRYCIQWLTNEKQAGRGLGVFANQIYESYMSREGSSPEFVWKWLLVPWDVKFLRPKIIQDVFMPFNDVVDFNSYQVARMVIEATETNLLYWESAWWFNGVCFMSTIMSSDVILYCLAINKRLEKLIAVFRSQASVAPANNNNRGNKTLYYDGTLNTSERRITMMMQYSQTFDEVNVNQTTELARETSEIQAMIADLFTLIDSYNKYISLQYMVLIVTWLGYSALVSSWIFLPGTESPKLEWYVIHFCSTLYVFIILARVSDVKYVCRRMYKLITVAMALDSDCENSKTIWVSLLKFYTPRPLYCFTLIGTIEITYMLGLKLLVWLFSALIVASSFFQVYNIK